VAAPVLTAIANGSVKPGFEVEITLTGTGLKDARAVRVDGKHVTVNSFEPVSDTTVKAKLFANIFAKVEAHNVTASTLNGESNAMVFNVITPPAPTLTRVDPPGGQIGKTYPIKLEGTNLKSVYSIAFGNPGLSFGDITLTEDDKYELELIVDPATPPGAHNIIFKSEGGTATIPFNVLARPLPVVTSVTPSEFQAGGTYRGIVLSGTDFEFALPPTISGGDITVDYSNIDSSNKITMEITVDPLAVPGDRDLVVTTYTGDSLPFVVKIASTPPPPPTLTLISPDKEHCGFDITVELTGTELSSTTGVTVGGTGVTVAGVSDITNTGMKVKLEISDTATPGDVDIEVTTLGGSETIPFKVVARPAPTLTSMAPNSGPPNGSGQIVINGTDIAKVQDVKFSGAGVTVLSIDSWNDSKVKVTIEIDALAAPGERKLTVTNHGGVSNELRFDVT
jgi:hypothetical protein